jgi:hypothetical protein
MFSLRVDKLQGSNIEVVQHHYLEAKNIPPYLDGGEPSM